MTVLPIVARELRVASRRWGTYVLRLGAASAAIALATMVYLFSSYETTTRPADMGKVIFGVLCGFAFLYALLIGVRVTSDCISSEKREGTLGLLFLTDLKGLDIVLGKLTASALDSFYALISTLPVLAIPILLGSVTPGEIWRAILSLLSTALFSVCAGMFVSALAVNERKATAGTFLLISFIAVGIPLTCLVLSMYLPDELVEWLFVLSPGTSIVAALYNNPREIPWEIYWVSIALTLLYAVVFAVLAAVIVPRIWQQRVEGRKVEGDRARDRLAADARRARRQQLLDVSPTCWLGGRGRMRGLWLWVFLACAAAGWLWAYSEDRSNMLELGMSLLWMYFIHGVLKIFVASEAVRLYAEDFQQGALELLLCTPLTVAEIVRGQLLNLVRYFRWPILAVLAADVFFLLAGRFSVRGLGTYPELAQWFVAGMIFFGIDCLTLSIVGLWHGLTSRNSRQAITSSLVRILVLPWIGFALFNLFTAMALRTSLDASVQLSLLAVISLAINGLFAWQAWERLHERLRQIAAARYGGAPGTFWVRLGRLFGRVTFRNRPA